MKKVKFKKIILSKSLVKFYEGDDFKEIRDYIPGEDVRNIHWISSAKHQKLLSIERENLKNQKILIIMLLDVNMLFEDKLEIAKEIFYILSVSAIFYKQNLTVLINSKEFRVRNYKEIEKIIEYIDNLDLKKEKINLKPLKHKGFLAIYIGDFFYKIKLNSKNKNVLLVVRKKVEENPKKLLFNSLISIDKKNSTFLDFENLKHYLNTLKKNDSFYKKEKIKKIYSKENILALLKETFE
ncbi:DUF58 domain-containing protein [Caminibacter sp.]